MTVSNGSVRALALREDVVGVFGDEKTLAMTLSLKFSSHVLFFFLALFVFPLSALVAYFRQMDNTAEQPGSATILILLVNGVEIVDYFVEEALSGLGNGG